ncbi:MAG: matrixin family metalloprotease [Myxococcota bacterium]
MRASGTLVALAFASTLGLSTPATAYICTRVQDESGHETGSSLSWFVRDLTYALDPAGTADIAGTNEFAVMSASFVVWQNLTDAGEGPSCASWPDEVDLTFTEVPKEPARTTIGYDYLHPSENENLLIFYDTGWPHADLGSGIIALTTTTYNAQTGEIIDADIELNSERFRFTVGDTSVSTDLENTTVHEIGHVLGLGHTSVTAATMYAGAELGETSKRTLACDDRDGIAFKYPAGAANGYCSPAVASCGYCAPAGTPTSDVDITVEGKDSGLGGCGCRASGAGSWALLGSLLAVGPWRTLRRRRRSRRH